MEKKIGIITMHKVLNYGSALQAYSLQKVIEDMGYDVEIIDYLYPNEYHKQYQNKPFIFRRIISYLLNLIHGNPIKIKKELFNAFYSKHLKLSNSYELPDELNQKPPIYDIYITGSDQVWNPNSIHGDTSFMLSFTDSPCKLAYAASFSTSEIPAQYKDKYVMELRKYNSILMREQSGCDLIKEIIGKDSRVVLDPTLLLDKQHWLSMCEGSRMNVDQPYILVYVLGYSFNVYPYVFDLIRYFQSKTKMRLVILSLSNKYVVKLDNKEVIHNASVYDFIKLFSKASLVITDSFHGTAFSLNMCVPFYSVVDNNLHKDSRILNLLKLTGESHRAIIHNTELQQIKINFDVPSMHRLQQLRVESLNSLNDAILGCNEDH